MATGPDRRDPDTDGTRADPPHPPAVPPAALFPMASSDETDVGWGEVPDPHDSDDERYLRERPPHHLG